MAPVPMDGQTIRPRTNPTQLKGRAMERNLISWNLPNWLTVLLMAAAGYAVLGLLAQFLKGQAGAAGG